jgi:hypothetical protein
LTTNSKVDVAALPEPARDDVVGSDGYVAPASVTQRRVARLWSDVLGVPQVGLYDNFFDLGGNSLALAKLHSRIVAMFGAEVPITMLFEHTTVAAQARELHGDNGQPSRPRRAAVARRPRYRSGVNEVA